MIEKSGARTFPHRSLRYVGRTLGFLMVFGIFSAQDRDTDLCCARQSRMENSCSEHDSGRLAGAVYLLIQAAFFSWSYPRQFNTRRSRWLGSAVLAALVFGLMSWFFTTLPVAAKFHMASVAEFMRLETGFAVLQFAVVAPLLALIRRQPATALHSR